MWLPTSPRSDSSLDATRPRDRAGRTFIIAAVALLLGAGAGGASMFAVVAALTAPPRDDPAASKTATAGTAARPTPVPAQPEPAPAQSENPPPRVAEITPSPQPVKPWPDALSRAHSADAATPPASSQSPPAPAAAPADQQANRDRPSRPNAPEATADKSGTADRTTAWRSNSKPPSAETKAAGPRTDDSRQARDSYGNRRFRVGEVTDDGQDRTPPQNRTPYDADRSQPKADRDAKGVTPKTGAHGRRQDNVDDDQQGFGASSDKSGRAIGEPRARGDLDDARGQWGGRDNWGAGPFGGLFGLFGLRDNWHGDHDNWRSGRDGWDDD
jgi:hypothetical protein